MPTAPDEIWANGAGASVVAGLMADTVTWLENTVDSRITYGLLVYHFTGSPNLSAVLAGHRLTVSGFTNAENDGAGLYITAKDNTAKTITVRQTGRLDASLDETGETAAASVANSGAATTAPSAAKQQQGFVVGEKPNAAQVNWKFNQFDAWIDYLANGGATVTRADIAAWKAVTRTGAGFELVRGIGLLYFDPAATDLPDDVNVFKQTTGSGRGFLELAHPDYLNGQLKDIFGVTDIATLYTILHP